MSSRARHLGVAGVVVEGRIRDLNELRAANFIAFSSGTSTLGAAPYSRVSTLNQPITLAADSPWPVTVHPGDVIVGDVDGVVRIPADKIDQVLALCKTNSEMDGKCMADIEQGVTIREAFAKHRGK